MMGFLATGWMAKRYRKRRGWVTACGGAALWLIAFVVLEAQDLVYSMGPRSATRPEGMTSLDWMALVLFAIGSAIALFGAWQLYRDEVHGDYLTVADRYHREGW